MLPSEIESAVYECYYSLLPRYWGNGYATDATRALVHYCFENYPIDEVRAYMSPENPASAAVAQRVRMTCLGIHEHPLSGNRGKVYSITREAANPT
jgi:RimJ/RimL family protein N-acetyltransferase